MHRRTFINLGIIGSVGTTLATAAPAPFQFIPRPSKEKWAVLFGTWYGTTRDASIWISEGLGGIASVLDYRQIPEDLAAYDHIVIGTAIHGGKGPGEFDSYIRSNSGKLKGKVRGLFACCGNMRKMPGPQQTQNYVQNYLGGIFGIDAVPMKAFGGRITKDITSPEDYRMIKQLYGGMGLSTDDFDNLKRQECLQFGRDILAASK